MDPELIPIDQHRYPDGKFTLHEGCLVQNFMLPRDVLEVEDKLLGMLGLGCNLSRGHVLADPTGLIEGAKRVVADKWGQRDRVEHRTQRAITFASQAVGRLDDVKDDLGRLSSLCDLVMQLAGVFAIASAVPPTHRKALVLAGTILAPHGRLDLVERLISALGAENADVATATEAISDAMTALTFEVASDIPAYDNSEEFRRLLPAFVSAGLKELVDQGHVREAMLPAMGSVALSARAGASTATAEGRATLDELVQRRVRSAGITYENWAEVTKAVSALANDVFACSRAIAAGAGGPQ